MSKLDDILIEYGTDAAMAVNSIHDGTSLMNAIAQSDVIGHQKAKREIVNLFLKLVGHDDLYPNEVNAIRNIFRQTLRERVKKL